MFCGECGTMNPDTSEVCSNCGKPLKKSQPAVQPAPSADSAPPAVQPAVKRKRNWTGILSILCGILSWVILTTALAIVAVAIGVFSLYKTRKETGKIAYSAIAGIIIAVAAVLVSVVIR